MTEVKRGTKEYNNIHGYIKYHYGSPQTCSNPKCDGKSKIYDWCLINGLEYEKKRENFIRLCRSCHRIYDIQGMTEKERVEFDSRFLSSTLGKRKLTMEQAMDIRKRNEDGDSYRVLAKEFGISKKTIYQLRMNKIYKEVDIEAVAKSKGVI